MSTRIIKKIKNRKETPTQRNKREILENPEGKGDYLRSDHAMIQPFIDGGAYKPE